MDKFFLTIYLITVSLFGFGQTVTVKSQNEKVKGEMADGFTTVLDYKKEEVNSSWNKFLKEIGKIKLFSSDPVVITDPNLNGTVYPKAMVYAYIFDNGNNTRVWLGIVNSEWESRNPESIQKQLEKLVYQFGIRFHRERVQALVDETQRALDAVEKQSSKAFNQNKDLLIKLGNNEKEKTSLEKAVEANKLENAALLIKLENNKKAQDSLINSMNQIKKVMLTHKEKLSKIN